MANKSISMTQIKRLIQLRSEGYSKLKIAQTLSIHRATLDNYLSRLSASGKPFTELMALNENDLISLVYSDRSTPKPDPRINDLHKRFDYYIQELGRPGVTRKVLWEEYKQAYPDGYQYAQFCEHFSRHLRVTKATMRLDHRAGEYTQFDFAGKKLHYIDRETGELVPCPVLVSVLPFSGYTYAEALRSGAQEYLFYSLNRCCEYFGGVTRNMLTDNMRQVVNKNHRYEYAFQELANQWAIHYNTNLEATRPRKPKDKSTVEGSVYLSYLRIYARLRNEVFYSLQELNMRIMELLEEYNHTSFQKLPGSRYERFIQFEKPLLRPLPPEPFVVRRTTQGKVQMNYHVVLGEDKHQYSVPYQYIGQTVKVIYDDQSVELYIGFQRVALHKRDRRNYGYSTLAEHMPQKHLKYSETLGWDAEYFITFASKIGESSLGVFKRILSSKEFVEQTYKACVGLKRLCEIYDPSRFEAACNRALRGSTVTYGMIKRILENNLDKQEEHSYDLIYIPEHENIRGSGNYS